MKIADKHSQILIIALILILSTLFAAAIGIKRHGDDPSYYSMVESFVNDGDFVLNNKDLQRWGHNELRISPSAAYVIMDKKGVIKYAKPVLYPLIIAAPFFFLGIRGLALLNGLFLGGCIVLSYLYLSKYFNRSSSLFIAGGFFLCSFMPAYVSWIHPEMMLYFACVLSMWFYKNNPALAALIMGIASSLRVEFFLLFVSLIIVLVFFGEFKELFKSIAMYLAGYGLMLFMNFLFLGQFSAYGGERYFIPGKIGQSYLRLQEIKGSLVGIHSMFEGGGFNSLELFWRNAANFFIGRFTGIIWYGFPAIVCVVLYLFYRNRLKREERIFGDVILASMLFLVVILIIARPLNYFGGQDFVCNRYLSILPCLLFLPWVKTIKKPGKVILLFLPGLIISSQVIGNDIFIKNSDRRYFAHTTTFPLKYAPLEVTSVESLLISKKKISDNTLLYLPLGLIKEDGRRILIDKGQEIIIVDKNNTSSLKLEADRGEIILRPEIILKEKSSKRYKSFYYFKATRLTWITDVKTEVKNGF